MAQKRRRRSPVPIPVEEVEETRGVRDSDEDEQPVASTSSCVMASPSKRLRRMVSFPETPTTNRKKPTFLTPAMSKTPFTPYPLRAYDSPTNPFGRKHRESVIRTLPQPTSFSKHLPLRFQFSRKGVRNSKEGVYRIVQVPLSYTFVHLRCLIFFLFGGGAKQLSGDDDDHLFELKDNISMYAPAYKPGQIKSGYTWGKLSSTRDPCRWRGEQEEDGELDENYDEAEEEGRMLEEEHNDWEWKDEQDFKLGHAWPEGLDAKRGIVYYHSRSTQVHITVNAKGLPKRKGKSNTPFVFSARGLVYLSPPPRSQPSFKRKRASPSPLKRKLFSPIKTRLQTKRLSITPAPKPESKVGKTDSDADDEVAQEGHFNESHPFFAYQNHADTKLRCLEDAEDSDRDAREDGYDYNSDYSDDDGEEDYTTMMLPEKWNDPETKFASYYRRYMGIPLIDLPHPVKKKKIFGSLFDDSDSDCFEPKEEAREEGEGYDEGVEDEVEYDPETDDTLVCLPTSELDPDPDETSIFPSSSPPPVPSSSSPQKGFALYSSLSPQKPFPSSSAYSSPQKGASRGPWSLTDLPSPSVYSPGQFNRSLFANLNAKFKKTPAPPNWKRVERMRAERVERAMERSKMGMILKQKNAGEAKRAKEEDAKEGNGGNEGAEDGEEKEKGKGKEEKTRRRIKVEDYEVPLRGEGEEEERDGEGEEEGDAEYERYDGDGEEENPGDYDRDVSVDI